MKYISQTMEFHITEPTALSIGKFDGRHLGHSSLLSELKKEQENGLAGVIFTFDVPPQEHLTTDTAREFSAAKELASASEPVAAEELASASEPVAAKELASASELVITKVLTTAEEKRLILEETGVSYLIECPFTERLRKMAALDFLEWIVERLHVKCIITGSDFRFGYQRAGDCRLLQENAKRLGYELKILQKIKEDEQEISSTAIREAILRGDFEKANRLLGYEYFIKGKVLHGNRIGHTIGIPTLNLLPSEEKLLPPNGVYVTRTAVGDRLYAGVTNVGCKPTIDGAYPVGAETYLIDFSEEIYGQNITVSFLKFLRPEQKFASVEALKQQMERDIAYSKQYFM